MAHGRNGSRAPRAAGLRGAQSRGRAGVLFLLAACVTVACSGSGGAGGGAGDDGGADSGAPSPRLGAACSATVPCGDGLVCAESGSLLGRCTFDCSSDQTLCERFGLGAAVCLNDTSCASTW